MFVFSGNNESWFGEVSDVGFDFGVRKLTENLGGKFHRRSVGELAYFAADVAGEADELLELFHLIAEGFGIGALEVFGVLLASPEKFQGWIDLATLALA